MADPIGPQDYLLSGQTTSGVGAVMDCRAALNYGFLAYWSNGPSAVIKFDASHDGTGWLPVLTVTASPTTASAQVSAFYPYVRGVVNSAFGGGGSTGSAFMHYSPGIGRL